MPKGSKELIKAREEEIVNACAELYRTKSFREITIRDIGGATTFSRTSIYNYFQTKEEIFLALLKREYETWVEYLRSVLMKHKTMTSEEFAGCMAQFLSEHELMLKLLSLDLTEMESNSRLKQLKEFKEIFCRLSDELRKCLETFFPWMPDSQRTCFLNAFFSFIFGVYPSTHITDKQREAIDEIGMEYVPVHVYDLTYSFVIQMLRS